MVDELGNGFIFQPILITDENIAFPECESCRNELSPFLVEDEKSIRNLTLWAKEAPNDLKFRHLWKTKIGIVMFMCKGCDPKLKTMDLKKNEQYE